MGCAVGVCAGDHIAAAAVEENRITGQIFRFPLDDQEHDSLSNMHADEIVERIQQEVTRACEGRAVDAVGVAFPGLIREGVVEECPNFPQMKGQDLATALTYLLSKTGIDVRVQLLNDADA